VIPILAVVMQQITGIFLNIFRRQSSQESEAAIPTSYRDLTRALRVVLEIEPGSSPRPRELLKELRARYPVPLAEIVDGAVWGLERDKLVLRTHAKSNIDDAKRNLMNAARTISSDEEQDLRGIMSHWCGWSPTTAEHCHDPWVRFLQRNYSHLKNLVPVLDSLVWEDEILQYPLGHPPQEPWLFLLATPSSFYIYDFQNATMMPAGKTLREVKDGLRSRLWERPESWVEEEPHTDESPFDYFPVYLSLRDENGLHKLRQPILENV